MDYSRPTYREPSRYLGPELQRPRPLAQRVLLDLPGGGRGQWPEQHRLRDREPWQLLAAERDQLVLRRLRVVLELDERARRLSPFLVGACHHGRHQDRG